MKCAKDFSLPEKYSMHFTGIACRHMYCILARVPCLEDFSPKYLKAFEVFYGVNRSFTQEVDCHLKNWVNGIPTLWPIEVESSRKSLDIVWFGQSLNRLYDAREPPTDDADGIVLLPGNGSDSEEEEDFRTTMSVGIACGEGSFSSSLAMLKLIHQNVCNKNDQKVVDEALQDLHFRLLAKRKKQNDNEVGGTRSLPSLEKRSKVLRRKCAGERR